MKKFICLFALCLCSLCLFSCSKFDENYVYDGHSLVGKWCEADYEDSYYISYEFFEDGTVELKEYCYAIEQSSTIGAYTAKSSQLSVEYKNYDGTSTYVSNRFCITEDGELVMIYLDEENEIVEKEMVLVPFNVDFNEDNSALVGTWEDTEREGEFWSFNKDYTGTISGNGYSYKFYYSVHDGCVYIANEYIEGTIFSILEFEFDIDGQRLTLEAEINETDVKYVFERK